MSLERVQADDPADDLEDIFTATFQVDGPNANAEVEIIVSDYVDEANVVSIALHIRKHELQDPADKRTIVADDKLRAVFGQDRATMFEMQKLLSPHLTAA